MCLSTEVKSRGKKQNATFWFQIMMFLHECLGVRANEWSQARIYFCVVKREIYVDLVSLATPFPHTDLWPKTMGFPELQPIGDHVQPKSGPTEPKNNKQTALLRFFTHKFSHVALRLGSSLLIKIAGVIPSYRLHFVLPLAIFGQKKNQWYILFTVESARSKTSAQNSEP